jgi:hypothetical protein
MKENFQKEINDNQKAEIQPDDYEKIEHLDCPLGLRMHFQGEVIKKMIAEGLLNEKDMPVIEVYGKLIADIIDNKENTEIRDLIKTDELAKAVDIMMETIRVYQKLSKAA